MQLNTQNPPKLTDVECFYSLSSTAKLKHITTDSKTCICNTNIGFTHVNKPDVGPSAQFDSR